MPAAPWIIRRDDSIIAIVLDESTAWATMHRLCPASIDHATIHEGYSLTSAEPWTADEARLHSSTARNVMHGDSWHNSGQCRKAGIREWERMSCGQCALRGWEPRNGWGDGWNVTHDGPNYAGWARVYVESRTPIPTAWREVFMKQLDDDNRAYGFALARSVATFGVRFMEEAE